MPRSKDRKNKDQTNATTQEVEMIEKIVSPPSLSSKTKDKSKDDSESQVVMLEKLPLNSSFLSSLDTPELPQCNLSEVVISAPHDENTHAQAERILKEFNKNVKKGQSCFVVSAVRGKQIDPGKFMLGIRNNVAELYGSSGKPIARALLPYVGQFTQILDDKISQSDSFYGACGTYVLNVPAGHYAKAKSGNKPLLYGEGCHVIHDPNFTYSHKKNNDDDTGLINQSEPYIKHGTIHILRVPTGKLAKIWIGSEAYILPGRGKPYVFNNALFQLIPNSDATLFYDQSELYISHGTIHILRVPAGKFAKIWIGPNAHILNAQSEFYQFNDPLFKLEYRDKRSFLFEQSDLYIHHGNMNILRVPAGKYAKVWIGSVAKILTAQDKPYLFDDPLFKLELAADGSFLFEQSDLYIQHGTKHIIRVPDGKIAKVWIGPEARLLEASKETYEFDDPLFRLQPDNGENNKNLFFDATSRLVVHGSIKRVIPHTGEVAITYDNGKLVILEPKKDGTPHIITSPTHEVTGFLTTGIETLVFPSEETKKQRLADNPRLKADEVSYECFTTRDSLKIGVKLLVAFRITDPEKALSTLLDHEGILRHIENVATVDMGKAIQKCSSQEFLNFYQTKPKKPDEENLLAPDAPPVLHYQDEVKQQLMKDLLEYGIELVRLNIETPKILDESIANEMAQASIQSAQANAQESTLEQKYRIAQRTAQQEAEKLRIQQEQTNNAQRSKAQAALDAVALETKAQITKAEADKQSMLLKAEAEAEAIKMRAEAEKKAMDLRGEALRNSPQLLELEIAKVKAGVLSNSTLTLTSPDLAAMFSRNPLTFFGGVAPQAANFRELDSEQRALPRPK